MLKAGLNALSFREDGRERPFVREDGRERPFVREDGRERPFVREDGRERPFVCARRGGEQQSPQDVILDDDEL
jgi:hypothetical protein